MRPKRIVMAVTTDLNTDQRVHREALALHQAGYEVVVVGRRLPESAPLPEMPYRRTRMRLPFHRGKWFYLSYNYFLLWKLLFMRMDILLAHDLDTLGAMYSLSRLKGKPLVYDAHELFTQVPELVRRPRTQAVWLRLERRVLPKLKFFYTVNSSVAEEYFKAYGIRPAVVRNLPLRQPQVPLREEPGNILLYQGALNEGRGIERMIAAMERLPQCILWIVGGGPQQEALRAMAAKSAARERIVFHGWVRFDALPALTRQATIGFSLEEDRGMNYRFSLPNKVLDCVQNGVPLLVSDLPEMAAVVRRHGVGEALAQEADLADAVSQLLADPVRWRQYHQACLRAAEELNWEKESDRLLAIFREVALS